MLENNDISPHERAVVFLMNNSPKKFTAKEIGQDIYPRQALLFYGIRWSESFRPRYYWYEPEVRKLEIVTEEFSRLERLINAPKKPEKNSKTQFEYSRNQDVIDEVLFRAKGVCGYCKQPAPFNRASDGSPYLEVHHVVPLAQDGDDTVANAVALCPNCHRKAHFG